jgi:hypothetical protein
LYNVSKALRNTTNKDLEKANGSVQQVHEFSNAGIYFDSGALSWKDAVIVRVTDASFTQEKVQEPAERLHLTQKAFMNLIMNPEISNRDSGRCLIWEWRSLTDKRVCRATLQDEAHGMLPGTEKGDRLRVIIYDGKEMISDMQDWQYECDKRVTYLWFTDCESLVSHLRDLTIRRIVKVRLSTADDAVRWTYTSSVKMDYLTKRMRPKVILKFKYEGHLDLKVSEEDTLSKAKKQKQRAAKKVATHTDQTIPNGCVVAYSNRS